MIFQHQSSDALLRTVIFFLLKIMLIFDLVTFVNRWISKYADDQNLFFEDFKNVYVKLVNAGAKWRSVWVMERLFWHIQITTACHDNILEWELCVLLCAWESFNGTYMLQLDINIHMLFWSWEIIKMQFWSVVWIGGFMSLICMRYQTLSSFNLRLFVL